MVRSLAASLLFGVSLWQQPATSRAAHAPLEECQAGAGAADGVLTEWDWIRRALARARATDTSTILFATRMDYHRTQDAGDTVFRQRASYAAGPIGSGWPSEASAAHLDGYARRVTQDSVSLVRPSIELLLAATFTADHCFMIAPDSVGVRVVAFVPRPHRANVPEIEGRFMIDSATHDLRRFEFSYVRVPGVADAEARRLGGMATFDATSRSSDLLMTTWRLRALHNQVEGSELLLVEAGVDTIWQHAPARLLVHVNDSTASGAVVGALVSIDTVSTSISTDSLGIASFAAVPIGNHSIHVRVGDREARVATTLLETATEVSIDMTRARQAATLVFAGAVRNAKTGRGIPDAEVVLLTTGEVARTDSIGRFRVTGLPAAPQTALVRRIGFAPRTVEVPLVPTDGGAVVIEMNPVAELDTVVVTDRATIAALSSFEDHRRIGLGHFWTREDLAAHENESMAQVLAQTPGMNTKALMAGAHGFVASNRTPGRTCYSQVYLDQALIYRGSPAAPFDVNSIRPEQVEAIEFYSGPAQLPAKYQGLNTTCGVLVIWTRRTP